jgi:hypothetical protein
MRVVIALGEVASAVEPAREKGVSSRLLLH